MASQTSLVQRSSQLTKCSHQTTKQADDQPKDTQPKNEQLQSVTPIGYIKSCFKSKNGTPRQPSVCTFSRAKLQVLKSVFVHPDHSLQGLEDYSHVWILFLFHKNGPDSYTKAKVKPPRLNGAKVGVFATRSPHRPNPVGLTLAKLDKVQGGTLFLSGVDIIEGTPVLDVKPYVPDYDNPLNLLRAQNTHSHEKQSNSSVRYRLDQTNVCDYDEKHDANSKSKGPYDPSEKHGDTGLNTDQGQSEVPNHSRPERVSVSNSTEISDEHGSLGNVNATHKSYRILTTSNVQSSNIDNSSHLPSTIATHQSEDDNVDNSSYLPSTISTHQSEDDNVYNSSHLPSTISTHQSEDDNKSITNLKPSSSDTTQAKDNHENSSITNNASQNNLVSCTTTGTDNKAVIPDIIDQRPVPYNKEALTDTVEVKVANWIATPPISRLQVEFTEKAERQLASFHPAHDTDTNRDGYTMDFFKDIQEAKKAICEILEADPRSTYRREKCSDRLYFFAVDTVHVTCWFYDNVAEVIRIQPLCKADIPST